MSITQKQIAEQVGVSQTLVAFAFNDNPRVNADTKQRILSAARRMGYDPNANRAARALAAKRHGTLVKTGVLALLVSEPLSGSPSDANVVHDNPFFLPFFNGVELEATARGYDIFVCTLREDELPRLIRSNGVDGVIGLNVPQVFDRLRALAIPALSLGNSSPDSDSIALDHKDGMRQAVEHLVAKGHKRIAYLGLPATDEFAIARERLVGFHEAMGACELEVFDGLVDSGSESTKREAGAAAADRLLATGDEFSALVCYNDWLAMGAIEGLQAAGRMVPDDIAVVGFDDLSVQAGFRPTVTSIGYDRELLGRRAVQCIMDSLESAGLGREQGNGYQPVKFPVRLVIRETA